MDFKTVFYIIVRGLVLGFLFGGGFFVLLYGNSSLDAVGGPAGWFLMGSLLLGLPAGGIAGIIIIVYKIVKNKWNTKQI